ncbi:MAG: RNA polymerase sigma factor [Leptolyngbya sp.]|nr:MAG: RNA polymerase sigma factor [Leptolyngbya sp.]
MQTQALLNYEPIVGHLNGSKNKKIKLSSTAVNSWLKQISLGNYSCFWNLWVQYQADLYKHCLRWMENNSADAEDVLSQAKLLAWTKLQQYANTITNLKAWLTRLTHNLCMDVWRKRRKEVIIHDPQESISQGQIFLASPIGTPESCLLNRELLLIIHRSIEELPDRLLQPFQLRFFQDCSYAAIADHLSITQGTARKRIQEAREFLRHRITVYLAGESKIHNSYFPAVFSTESN